MPPPTLDLRSLAATVTRKLPEFRGKRRLIRTVDRAAGTPTTTPFHHASGAHFSLGPRLDIIEQELLYIGHYGLDVQALLRPLLTHQPRTTFWDIGANIGSVSLPLLAALPGVTAHLFEPSPPVLARLAANAGLNPGLQDRLRVYGFPLGASVGPVEFWTSVEPGNSGLGGLGRSHNRVSSPIVLHGMTGDALIAGGVPEPDVIKIDVEGFEYEVFSGMQALLGTDRPLAIVFEHSAYRFEERGVPKDQVVQQLRAHGFRVLATQRGVVGRDVTAADLERESDFLALRG